jgi:hypothetical protein
MSFRTIRIVYWATLALSVCILLLNVGLVLIGLGLLVLPILVLHVGNGIGLDRVKERNILPLVSTINLLAFALVRPEGVHAITENGLSAFLDVFGINSGFNRTYEGYYSAAAIALLVIQLIIELWVRKLIKSKAD